MNEIEIKSAENKDFRVRYYDRKNIPRFYYPDFYIPQYDGIIEVKPKSMLNTDINVRKIEAAKNVYDKFFIVTEEDLVDLSIFFEKLNRNI